MPLAFLISKIIKVDFQNKENPLTTLGIIVSVNQMLYILIAMWVYASVPDKMVMVYAMIFVEIVLCILLGLEVRRNKCKEK